MNVSVLQWFQLDFCPLALRLMISLAAAGLMGKKTDLQQPPRSLIEYGKNVIPHLQFTQIFTFVQLACGPVCLRSLFSSSASPQMSLTLEEKQRLAKEQEQAAKLRNQQPLAPQTVRPASANNSKVTPENVRVHKQMLKDAWCVLPRVTDDYAIGRRSSTVFVWINRLLVLFPNNCHSHFIILR